MCKVDCSSGYLGEQHVLRIMETRLMPLTKMGREFCACGQSKDHRLNKLDD